MFEAEKRENATINKGKREDSVIKKDYIENQFKEFTYMAM